MYRILTEDRPNVEGLARKHLRGFFLTRGTGYYEGSIESSVSIETTDGPQAYILAGAILQANNQREVWVIEPDQTIFSIKAGGSVEKVNET